MASGPRIGRYEVLARLTKGGMAELSLASTDGPGGFRKYVVLKRILPEAAGDENFVRMFLDEARVTGGFSHPNICQVFELGTDPDAGLFVAMEFIAGQDLNQVVSACATQQAVLPLGFSAAVVHDCALALHYAHTFKLPNGESSPVIHRDVAQKNIMVTYDGQVKLLDFGIAKAKGALARTRAGTIKGTAGYMSPEQVRGEPIDGRSDVFALGVVLWEMSTGRRLFSAETEVLELKMILSAPVTPPHEVEPSVPMALSEVVMKALERDVNQRYRSARELARALQSQCAGLLFDAEERATFMHERFAERIESIKGLFDVSASNDEAAVEAAVRAFRDNRTEDNLDAVAPKAKKLKAAPARSAPPKRSRTQLSGRYPRLADPEERETTGKHPASARGSSGQRERITDAAHVTPDQFDDTSAAVEVTPPPKRAWVAIVVGALIAVGTGVAVWLAMSSGSAETLSPRGEVEAPTTGTNAQAEPLEGTVQPPSDPEPPGSEPVREPVRRGQGEVTLAIPEGATVLRGREVLGSGTIISFKLPSGTHLLTVQGDDGVKRRLSMNVVAGKKERMRFRLADLPSD